MTVVDVDAELPDEGRMTLIEHLTELRTRLIRSFAAIAVGAVVCWIAYPWILQVLLDPYCASLADGSECSLFVRNPLEPFNVRMTVAGYGGLALALPVVLWQTWRFIAPGLYRHERRYASTFIVSGIVLFALGGGLAYWSLPRALSFLREIGGSNLVPLFSPQEYLGFIIKMIVAFGISFEFPIVLVFLQMMGVVANETLRRGRQYTMVGIVVFAAVVTPSGDPFTLMMLSVPMYLLYEIAILYGRLRERRARRREAAAS
ncbi:MAG: twin-arginine translocase subunit TatC [Actinomyces sp.]|nr:MAG: twin-arginine translocase subunit TatC [Actinomyces sp.]